MAAGTVEADQRRHRRHGKQRQRQYHLHLARQLRRLDCCTLSARPGYQLSAITDNGTDCLARVADNGYTMSNVTAGHTVAATPAPRTYVINDVLAAYRSMLGQPLSEAEKVRYDVAPLGGDGRPAPDGTVDVADVVLLLRKLVGVLNW